MIPAQEALKLLRDGNARFVSGIRNGDDATGSRRRIELAAQQSPFAIILGCSDSRVPAEIVFDQGLGDLFVIRVAGNIVAPSQIGSVEFAAERFGTRLVVVLGHSSCGAIVATLDGDGQNDPAFLPELIAAIEQGGERVGLAAGQRVGRKDTAFKRIQSRTANAVRNAILRDGTRDTGCGLKAFRREVFLMMPYFDGLHRFLPALVRREGYEIAYVDVIDRPRHSGVSNYGFFDRLWIGIMDLAGVWWLIRRKKPTPVATEVTS